MVVERRESVESGDIVVAEINGEFTVKEYKQERQHLFLVPANGDYKPRKINRKDDFKVWGIVNFVVQKPQKKRIMKILIFALALCCPFWAAAQDLPALPSNFQYQRETGEKSGKPFFHVMPRDESIAYDALHGNTFEALGALIQPELDVYGLAFMNAKRGYQFSTSRDKSCTITTDNGEKFEFPKFTPATKAITGRLKIESVAVKINKIVFDKIVDSDDVTIRCGIVKYNLNAGNIDALRYLANEADADLERRGVKLKN